MSWMETSWQGFQTWKTKLAGCKHRTFQLALHCDLFFGEEFSDFRMLLNGRFQVLSDFFLVSLDFLVCTFPWIDRRRHVGGEWEVPRCLIPIRDFSSLASWLKLWLQKIRSNVEYSNICTPPKTKMDTQNSHIWSRRYIKKTIMSPSAARDPWPVSLGV